MFRREGAQEHQRAEKQRGGDDERKEKAQSGTADKKNARSGSDNHGSGIREDPKMRPGDDEMKLSKRIGLKSCRGSF